jgi:photosystem II stability/assembly factor-like uncharacterized protein
VDIRHQDFRLSDGTTRIKFLLDFSDPGDLDGDGKLDGPDDFGGTLYTEDEINRILRSPAPPRTRDTTGHGTHGLSVAAGDDPELPGIAPGATLIVVKATRRDGTLDFEAADLLNALAFVDRKAAELKLPYVVNLSLGTSYGPHDGRTAEELAIDTLVGPGVPGKAVVLAAGNSNGRGEDRFLHFQGTAYTGLTTHHTLTIPPYAGPTVGTGNDTALLNLWYEGDDRLTIRVTAPDGATTVEAKYGDFADTATPFGQVFIGNMGGRDPRNSDTEAVILLYDKSGRAPTAGDWRITLVGEAVTSTGTYHGWLVDGASVVGGVAPYLSANADNRFLISRPAGAEHGITVGSFAHHDPSGRFRNTWTDVHGIVRVDPTARPGDISNFSASGPTRDGRLKPEIVAPGEQVIGAVSQDAYPGRSPYSIFTEHPFLEPDALIVKNVPEQAFGVMQGTSFSAPVVTGLVARLLADHPTLDAVQVKNILLNGSLNDSFTGAIPNESWGYGKAELGLATQPGDPIPSRIRIVTAALSSGVVGQQYNATFSASGGTPPYTWEVDSGSLPGGINFESGDLLTGIPSTAGSYEFTVRVEDSSTPHETTRRGLRLLINDRTRLDIVTANLPAGDVQHFYTSTLQAKGGTPPYVWSLVRGELPPGIHLSPEGNLSGTPLLQGHFFLTLSVADVDDAALRSLRFDVGDSSKVSWQPVGLDEQFVRLLSIDPNDPNHLVAGASTYARRNFVFQSFNAGRTWSEISLHKGLPFDWAATLDIDPVTSEIWALAYAPRFPYRYNPARQEWMPVLSCYSQFGGVNYSRAADIEFDAAGNILLLPYYMNCPLMPAIDAFQGFIQSTDRGRTWRNIGLFPATGTPDLTGNEQLGHLSVFLSDSRHLYASRNKDWLCCEPLQEQFFRSNDGGASWSELPINIPSVSKPYVSQSDPFDIIRGPWNPDEYSSIPWRWDFDGTSAIERSVNGGLNWEAHEISGNRRLCKLERSLSNPSVLLAGTTDGLFKSQDHGKTWQSLSIGGSTANFCEGGALAIDPSDSQKIYVGLKNARVAASTDGGVSWRVGGEGLFRRLTSGVAISPSRPTDLLLISGAPFVSQTSGNRWTLSSQGIVTGYDKEGHQFPIISRTNPDLFFFVGAHGWDLYRSENRGISWERLEPTFGRPTTFSENYSYQPGIRSLIADPFDANVLIARVHFFETTNGIISQSESMWRSNDRGSNWHLIPEPAPSTWYPDWVAPSIAFAGDKPGHLYALGPEKLYESLNGGDSWGEIAQLRSRGGDFFNYRLVVEPALSDPLYIYVIANEFVGAYNARSATWNWNDFPDYEILSSIAVDSRKPMTAYLGRTYARFADPSRNANNETGGIDKTTDGGRSWSRLTSFPKSLSVISLETGPDISVVVYAATLEDGVYRSPDGGLTWEKLNNFGVLADVVNVAVKDPNNPNLLFAGTQGFGVQVSTNDGQTFVPRVKGLGNLNVTSLAFDPGSPQILYAGTENGLFKSSDSGSSWGPTAFADGLVTDISVDTGTRPRRVRITTFGRGFGISHDEGRTSSYITSGFGSLDLTSISAERRGTSQRLWLTLRGGEGVMVSDDLGATWRPAGGSGLSTRNINDLAVEPVTGRVWIATDEGVFWTEDGGATWSDLSAGLPRGVPLTSLSINPDTGELLVSLFDERNGGVYRGGNISGFWSSFNEGLQELRVRKLTNDGGHAADGQSRATTFFAGTAGAGLFSVDIKTADTSPQITTTALSHGVVGELYSQPLKVHGGTAPYTWSLARGALPSGLGLEAATGVITGTPVQTGSYRFTVRVADSFSRSALHELEIQVRLPSTVFLRVVKDGQGAGTVKSEPAGIDCGRDCGEVWTSGVQIRLIAVPSRGSVFVRWSEPSCKGTTCTLTLKSDWDVRASFKKRRTR